MRKGVQMRRAKSERGLSEAVEAAIVLPAAMLLVGLVIVGAGHALAQQSVTAAANRAARAASLARTPAEAERAAREAAHTELGSSAVTCSDTTLAVDTSSLSAPLGTPASVTATVSCRARFPVALPGLPASRLLSAEGKSPVDTYRSRHG